MAIWLVVLTILKNMSSSMGRIIPYIMENKKCSKPPTSHWSTYYKLWCSIVLVMLVYWRVAPTSTRWCLKMGVTENGVYPNYRHLLSFTRENDNKAWYFWGTLFSDKSLIKRLSGLIVEHQAWLDWSKMIQNLTESLEENWLPSGKLT